MISFLKYKEWIIWILIPVFALVIAILYIYTPSKKLFPSSLPTEPYSFNEKEKPNEMASNIISFDTSNQTLTLAYELNKQRFDPYAGIGLFFRTDIDFSDYDEMTLVLEMNNTKSCNIDIASYYIHPINNNKIKRVYRNEVPKNSNNQYVIKLDQFQSPPWWYNTHKINAKEAGPQLLKQIFEIQISTGSNHQEGEKNTIVLKSIELHKSYVLFSIISLALLIVYYLFLFFFNKIKQSIKPLFIPYKELEVISNNEKDKVINFINSNYNKPDLSLQLIQKEIGISNYRISQVLKSQFDLSFKQYINSLRITEAKRLLLESELQITEIAFHVGYNTITHFNKVFKDELNITPTEFRQSKTN